MWIEVRNRSFIVLVLFSVANIFTMNVARLQHEALLVVSVAVRDHFEPYKGQRNQMVYIFPNFNTPMQI